MEAIAALEPIAAPPCRPLPAGLDPAARPALSLVRATRTWARPAAVPAGEAVPALAGDGAAARARASSRAGELYASHGAVVYRRCLRLLRDREAAKDATQEVFCKLLQERGRLEGRVDLVPWLHRVATNHCLNLLRDARYRRAVPVEDPETCQAPPDRLEALLAHRLLARFDAGIQRLAMAALVEEQDPDELAAGLGLSRRTLARKLQRFVERARHLLVVAGEVPATRRAR